MPEEHLPLPAPESGQSLFPPAIMHACFLAGIFASMSLFRYIIGISSSPF